MPRRTKTRIAATASLALVGVYLLVAYFLVPEIWVFRDAGRLSDFGDMVTMTEQDIPGDPINVGLVGSKEQVIRAFAAARLGSRRCNHLAQLRGYRIERGA